ncbi:glutamyl-tRNA amidotransferase [Amylibacter kogurei]|uniref:Glutamyl-tRNA amidotransferase n=1 Tax=Paramylibacter kogurei TaxID=1889778 RepID=A0A2G5K5Z0_9RHOB|nr:GatB/YqeY domain-containing protein [Amylibacter kogurei]PIB24529.1 glutamyl-tRNA amidotransferase [Amylibacter kogurei]
MRDTINTAVKAAMKAKESERLATLRLINAAIKDRDIAVRAEGNLDGVSDQDILGILGKMIKQRNDSAKAFHDAGRTELEKQELSEIKVIEEFLPKQLSEDETREAVKSVIDDLGADSIRDMGKVMGALKENYAGQMDFGKAGGVVKALLS